MLTIEDFTCTIALTPLGFLISIATQLLCYTIPNIQSMVMIKKNIFGSFLLLIGYYLVPIHHVCFFRALYKKTQKTS